MPPTLDLVSLTPEGRAVDWWMLPPAKASAYRQARHDLALWRVMTKVSAVQLLPTHCRACGQVTLARRDVQHQVASLCDCGGQAFVVPGPSFAEHEVALFDWLVKVARYAQLRPAEAQRVCIEIETGLASADQPGTFARMTQRFPSLAQLAPQLVDSPARLARALRMLETILNALSIPGKSLSLSTAPVAQRREA